MIINYNIEDKPKIVCLCGSCRFWKQFQESNLDETLLGHIVLSVGVDIETDKEHFGHLSLEDANYIKIMLDKLHKKKIDLCDEVLVLNVGGYIGKSTRSEINYATKIGKPIRYLENK
jgi:hypothetical protein